MYTFHESTTLVALSELRTKWDKIMASAKKGRVIIARRNSPSAVLMPIEQYEEMERVWDQLEDYALALKARERETRVKSQGYIPLDKAIKKFK